MDESNKADFTDALRRLLRVPRHEMEAEERNHRADLEARRKAKGDVR